MQKFLKAVTSLGLACSAIIFSLIGYAERTVPNEVYVTENNQFEMKLPYTVEAVEKTRIPQSKSVGQLEKTDYEYEADVKVLKLFPAKSTKVTVTQRRYVNLGGSVFGIRIYTNGVVVVKTDSVTAKEGSKNPAGDADLQIGDLILKINGKEVNKNTDVSQAVEDSNGENLMLEIQRNEKPMKLILTPALSSTDGRYRAGVWVRDSSAGIGTLTFYDSKTEIFAGLGHAVCDVDTGKILPLSSGDAVSAVINGCYKGKDGKPGELCGSFASKKLGSLNINLQTGIYGFAQSDDLLTKQVPVALTSEVKEGKAQILSTIDADGPQYYDIEITKIYSNINSEQKNMVIKVIDGDLIEKTGGIVQGMSGSPIIQNNMIVGAVTHVFVNDPLQGYAIYAQTMLDTSDSLFYSVQKQAS